MSTRSTWQITQGAACGCGGGDDLCVCQNENPWPRPRRDYEAEIRSLETKLATAEAALSQIRAKFNQGWPAPYEAIQIAQRYFWKTERPV